jgi:hypothetical protein
VVLKRVGRILRGDCGCHHLFGAALAAIPVSTTHTITGTIVGRVGSTYGLSAVRSGRGAAHCMSVDSNDPKHLLSLRLSLLQ